MSDQISIRAASENDVLGLLGLYFHLSSDSEQCPVELAKQNIIDLAKYEGSAVLLGEIGDQITTTCTLIVIPNLTRGGMPYALIENVVTHPSHRGQGFGKLILDAASERAWQHGCYKIMLSTGSRKPSTLAFYERAGFEQSRTGFQKRRITPRPE